MSRRIEKPVVIRIIFSFLIATILFVDLFFFSNFISYLNYKEINTQNNAINADIDYLHAHLENLTCDDSLLLDVSGRLDNVGKFLSVLEERFGKSDSRVLEEKKLYSLLEYEHFQIVRKLSEMCKKDFVTVLFFYSNEGDLVDKSESFSYIIGSFKKQSPYWIMVYSFDYNLDLYLIDSLKQQYNVTSAPSISVNGNKTFYLDNINQLDDYI